MSGLTPRGREREGHIGLVYATAQLRNSTVAGFVGEGLRLGEQVVFATGEQGWESALAEHGVDIRGSFGDGSLATLDAPHFYRAEGQAALVDGLLGSGRPGVRLVVSAEGALAYLGESEFRRVEEGMDDLCQTRPVMLLCHLRSEIAFEEPVSPALGTFVDTHADDLRGPLLTIQRTPGRVRLRGEADLGSAGLVEAVLAASAREDPGATRPHEGDAVLVLDLSELEFLDVAGYRALHRGTEQWRARGGTVLLTGASRIVRRLVELAGGPGADGDVRPVSWR